jgi:chromosome segregation ATPase
MPSPSFFYSLPLAVSFLLLLGHSSSLRAQTVAVTADSRLPGLLAERKVLTRQYAEASAQRHSLFGNKPSKKDLQEVVNALQGIVDKDEEIVKVLNEKAQKAEVAATRLTATTTHLETASRGDRNLTSQRLYEVQNELENLRVRERKHVQRGLELEAELKEAQAGRRVRDALVAALALVCAGLLVARLRTPAPPVRRRQA